jgi:hypothetical protein
VDHAVVSGWVVDRLEVFLAHALIVFKRVSNVLDDARGDSRTLKRRHRVPPIALRRPGLDFSVNFVLVGLATLQRSEMLRRF